MIRIAANRRGVLIGVLVAASLGQAAMALVIAYCVQSIFNSVLSKHPDLRAPAPLAVAGFFIVAAIGAALLEMYRAWAGEKLGLGYIADIRATLFSRIMSASPATLRKKQQGSLLLPFVGDLTAIKKWISDGLVRLISASVTGTLLLGVLAYENLRLAEAAAAVVLTATAAAIWLSGPLSKAIRETRSRRGAVANFVSSSFRAASTILAFNRLDREERRLERRTEALTHAGLRLARLSGAMSAIVHLAATLLVGLTLFVGVIEVHRGAMSIGLVAAAISIAGLLAGAVRDLGMAFELWRRAEVSFSKITAVLAMEPALEAPDSGRGVGAAEGRLSLEDVSASGLFDNVRVTAAPGAVVNIVGESGAGKSALLAIIARLREPDAGRVRLNGRDLRRISLSALRRRIGIASPAMPLMRGTLAMNLSYRAPNAPESELERVIVACNLEPVVERLPTGRQTRLGDGATELSRGEAQRLLIARALVGSPRILILDEVDTHLDETSALRIAKAIQSYPGIVLMTATMPQLLRTATATWRIANGRLTVSKPDHADLHGVDALESIAPGVRPR